VPTISTFFGILIKMNFKDAGQHNAPHFHAYYGDSEAVFGFDGEVIAGSFPVRQSAYIKAWTLLHEDALYADWALAVNGQETFRISPLS